MVVPSGEPKRWTSGPESGTMPNMSESELPPLPQTIAMRTASDFTPDANAREPQWEQAPEACFDRINWGAGPPTPEQRTCARILWTPKTFYLRFDCHYKSLTVFPPSSAQPDGRRMGVWERDIVEAFIQPDPKGHPELYKEMDIAPNGLWIDLFIDHSLMFEKPKPGESDEHRAAARARVEQLRQWRSHARQSASIDRKNRIWRAEWAIPMATLTEGDGHPAEAGDTWRIGMFRQEGLPKETFEWSPTGPPSFHVPSRFGYLVFRQTMHVPQKK